MVAIDGDAADAEATDEGMRAAAIGLLSVLRREDVACRYDDHAFAVLAFTENRLAATALADRVRTAVAGASPRRSVAEPPPHPTVSVGLALSHYSVGDSLLWHASEALAHARRLSPGTTQFGGELSELHLVDRSFN
jgi:GGDEF domain-containing protein